MIPADAALELVRDQLRKEVLPLLDGNDYARSVLAAAIAVLGEIAPRVRESDSWSEESVRDLEASGGTWAEQVKEESGGEILQSLERCRTADTLAAKRTHLLDAAEIALRSLWAAGSTPEDSALHGEIVELIAADNQREVAASDRGLSS